MAYGDPVYIQPQNEGPAPVAYKLAARQQIEPMTAQATYDGSGAGGDFVPALAFYSNNGRLLARAVVGSTVTAGDTASVSWFPFAQGASAPAPGGSLKTTDGTTTVDPTTELFIGPGLGLINLGSGTAEIETVNFAPLQETFGGTGVLIANGAQSALPMGHIRGAALLDYSTPTAPTVVARGTYAFMFGLASNTYGAPFAAGDNVLMQPTVQSHDGATYGPIGYAQADPTNITMHGTITVPVTCDAGAVVTFTAGNYTNQNPITVQLVSCLVVQLSPFF